MEIHYIWIEDFNNIKAKPVTLSSKYIFKTKLEKVKDKSGNEEFTRKGKITILDNPDYIENFFEKDNITNVSAIIGKNGAGKTSILEFIKNHFPEGLSSNIDGNLIVALTSNGENQIIIPKKWNVQIEQSLDKSFNQMESDNLRFSSDLSKPTYFYYTFNLDYKIEVENWAGLINLSTATLLCQPKKSAISERWNKYGAENNPEVFTFDLVSFKGEEMIKTIQFLNSEYKDFLPFTPPLILYLNILQGDKIHFTKKDNVEIFELLEKLENKNKKHNNTEQAVNNFYISVLLNFLVTTFKYSAKPHDFDYYTFNFSMQKESIREFVFNFFVCLKDVKAKTKKLGDIPVSHFIQLSKIVPDFINCFDNYILENKLIISEKFTYIFKLTKDTENDFKIFFNYYAQSKGITDYLVPNWRNLSTGQQSFLSFVSRFYHERHHAIGNDDLKELVIMIDEGDSGFHPEWQKEFFNNSLNFIAELFKENNVQLIYTANAPYIVSDLPKNHITFLENREEDVIIQEKDNNKEQTFGQNIHTLLSNSFFMNEGLIGDFSKKKINKVITILKSEAPTDKEIKFAREVIEIIGEPVIFRKLSNMFEAKFDIPISIDDEIKRIEKRLKYLKKINKK